MGAWEAIKTVIVFQKRNHACVCYDTHVVSIAKPNGALLSFQYHCQEIFSSAISIVALCKNAVSSRLW